MTLKVEAMVGSKHTLGADTHILNGGVAEINRYATSGSGGGLDLKNCTITTSNLSGALLKCADLRGARFSACDLRNADLSKAMLHGAAFVECNLSNTKFKQCDLRGLTLSSCTLDNADFSDACAFSEIVDLKSCRVEDRNKDCIFTPSACRSIDRYLAWDKIRTVGNLKLFLPSYVALCVSLFTLYVYSQSNILIKKAKEFIASYREIDLTRLEVAQRALDIIQPYEPSWRHFAVLISTIALSAGSTLYLMAPSRVQGFSPDEWNFIIRRPSFEYYVTTWSNPALRIACTICYTVGGTVAIILLADTTKRVLLILTTGLVN